MRKVQFMAMIAVALVIWAQSGYSEAKDFILNSRDPTQQTFERKLRGKPQQIRFSTVLEMPASEESVPWLHFFFEDSRERLVSKVWIDDEECTGEFHSRAQFNPTKRTYNIHYFKQAFPWPEEAEVVMNINNKENGDYLHTLTINNETHSFKTFSKLRKLKMESFGSVEIFGFAVE